MNPLRHAVTMAMAMGCALIALTFGAGSVAAQRAERPEAKVGDRWRFEQRDQRTGVKEYENVRVVTAVDASRISTTESGAPGSFTADWSPLDTPRVSNAESVKYLDFPLEVGKKWAFKTQWNNKITQSRGRSTFDVAVVAQERVKVPAGEFDAFKVEAKGFWNNDTNGRNGRITLTYWFTPAARHVVRTTNDDGYNLWVNELMELQLHP